MGGFVVRPGAEPDAPSVSGAVVGRDEVGPCVAFDFLIPDVDSRAVAVELIAENDVVLDRLFDKNTVASVGVAAVEKGGAVDRMGIEVDAVHIIPATHIRDGVNAGCTVAPDSTAVVSINITAVHEERIRCFASLGI